MLRHVVMFRWSSDSSEADRRAAVQALHEFGESITDLGRLTVGADAGMAQDNFDAVVVVDFPDADGYRRYVDDPRHVDVVTRYVRPILAERAAAQTDLG